MRTLLPPVPRAESLLLPASMALRPTTAEILAAARAAGSRSAPAAAASTSDAAGVGTVTLEPPVTQERHTQVPAPAPPSINGDRTAAVPPSIGSILRDVKVGREGSTAVAAVPPAVMSMLAQIRGTQAGTKPTPPSMAKILADMRHACGTTAAVPALPAETAPPASVTAPKRRPSTSEILAATRKKASGAASEPPATLHARSHDPAPPKTSSILEAAQRQGGAGSAGTVAPTAGDVSRFKVAPAITAKSDGTGLKSVGEASRAARPKAIADVLAAARAAVAGEPDSFAETSFPPLRDMVAELRQSDRRRSTQIRRGQQEPIENAGLLARFRRWVSSAFGTHQGASI